VHRASVALPSPLVAEGSSRTHKTTLRVDREVWEVGRDILGKQGMSATAFFQAALELLIAMTEANSGRPPETWTLGVEMPTTAADFVERVRRIDQQRAERMRNQGV